MVAIVISLVVLGGVMQLFISTRHGARVQTDLARVQENARFVLENLARTIRMTGFQGNSASDWVLGALSQDNGGVTPIAGTEDDTNGSDTISVTYMGTDDGFVRDCLGNSVGATTTVVNTYSLDASGNLQCQVARTTGATTTTTALVLSPDVDAMHVLYGIDTDSDDSANVYVSATNSAANMNDTVSIRVALLFRTTNTGLAIEADSDSYTLLNDTFTAGGDTRLRRLVTSTINLRNHL